MLKGSSSLRRTKKAYFVKNRFLTAASIGKAPNLQKARHLSASPGTRKHAASHKARVFPKRLKAELKAAFANMKEIPVLKSLSYFEINPQVFQLWWKSFHLVRFLRLAATPNSREAAQGS